MDYEKYRQAINLRMSCRKFTGSPITEADLDKLRALVCAYNEESGLSMQLIIGDPAPFDAKQAMGLFQGSAGYLALIGKTNDPNRMEKEGYFGERFVLEATSMGLGTCWVASSFDKDKSKAAARDDETFDIAIVFGKGEQKLSIREKIVRTYLGTNHRTQEDIAPDAQFAPDWFKNGIEAVMKAPSTKNTKPFSFSFENGTATAKTVGNHERVKVDLGIAKLHFEVGAGGGRWELGDGARYDREAGGALSP